MKSILEVSAPVMKKLILICAALLILAGCGSTEEGDSAAAGSAPVATVTVTPLASPTVKPEKKGGEESGPAASETPSPEASGTAQVGAGPWNGDLAALSLKDFPTQPATGDMIFDSSRKDYLYLVTQLPKHNIWLYGLAGGRGVILRCGGRWEYFDLTYLTPHGALPGIAFGDYDGDGQGEVAVDLHVDENTSGGVQELHIFEVSGQIWTDQWLREEDYEAILEQSVRFTLDPGTHTLTGQVGVTAVSTTPSADQSALPSLDGYSGSFDEAVSFDITTNPISAAFRASLRKEHTQLIPVGTIHADVVYTGSTFGLANLSIAQN